MTNRRGARLWVLLCLMAVPSLAVAQDTRTPELASGPPPAHIAYIEGRAFIDREGRSDEAAINMPLADGDRLRVDDGRVEIILPDGSMLHLDQQTTVDALAPDLWRLMRGRVILTVRGVSDASRAVRYQIDAAAASVRTDGPGEFRVWASETDRGRDIELAVSRGQATLANELGAQPLRAGERSYAREGFAPSAPQYFNSARWDAFDRWSATRRDTSLAVTSSQYLPDELGVYASSFDQYGTWRVDPTYGNVWYPTVGADWRPYSAGYWQTYPAWGSFWIGSDPWGWPTHHYGRWGFSIGFGWYWMPSNAWAPAWVYWGVSSNYVSWCALGYNNYPVYGNWGVYGSYYGRGHDPWRGWNVMPRQHFGAGMPVQRYGVDGHGLPPNEQGAFVAQRRGPGNIAVPRSYAGGGLAVPRGTGGPSGQAAPEARPRNGGGLADAARGTPTGRTGERPEATRRVFSTEAPRAGVPRTEAPSSAPDTTAFSSRRSGVPRDSSASGVTGAPDGSGRVPAENRYRARALPESMRSIFPSDRSAAPAARESVPRGTAPRSEAAPRSQPTRRDESTPSYQAPQRYEAPQRYQAPQRDQTPSYQAPRRDEAPQRYETPQRYQAPQRDQAPSYQAPRAEQPRYSAPQYQAPRYEQPSRSDRSAPRGEPSSRPGPSSGGSSGMASPRYNPGSSAGSARSGGSAPPSRRRGGTPVP
jgi:hypothetical protein